MSEENLGELADSAYRGSNYEQAYEYYTRILENASENAEAWLRKGICAGWLSEPDEPRFEEMHVCIDKAKEKEEKVDEEELSEQVMEMSEDFLASLYGKIDDTIQESEKESVATGELRPVKQFGTQVDIFGEAGDRIPQWMTAFEQVKFACDTAPNTERYRKAIREIDAFERHSSDNMDYLKNHKDAGDAYERLMEMRKELLEAAKDLDPDFTPDTVSQSKGRQAGCFVLTATYGSRQHPTVARFRRFRDQVLLDHSLGRLLINTYYSVGPFVARIIERSTFLRKISHFVVIKPASKIISWISSRRSHG